MTDFFTFFIVLAYYASLIFWLCRRTGFGLAPVVIAIFCLQSLFGSLLYLVHKITPISIVLTLVVPFLGFLIKNPNPQKKLEKISTPRFLKIAYVFLIILELALLTNLFLNQTTEPSPSPWLLLGPSFFFLYFVTTLLVLIISWLTPSTNWRLNITSFHLFTTYSVVAIMYPLGFGFDGHIHRATEEWIKLHGFIAPKLPLYIGQYTWVVFLSHITKLSISLIDIWLIPIAAAFILPRIISNSLVTFFEIPKKIAICLMWLLPFIYFFALFLTTPFNILILLTIVVIFSGLIFAKTNSPHDFIVPCLSALAGLLIHPLLGAPLAVFTAALFIIPKIKSTRIQEIFLLLYGLAMTFLVPVLFMSFLYITRDILPTITNPLTKINIFLQYSRAPFWYKTQSLWYWEIVYYWELLIPIVVLVLSGYGFYKLRNKINSLYLVTALALWMSAFFLRSWVVFPDVHALEQGDYPLRLLKSGLLFILPFGMAGLYFFGKNMLDKVYTNVGVRRLALLFFIIAASALTVSFYLSYPQWNQKVKFPGYNVSGTDIEAVHWIKNDADGEDYIVLSNPITAAAALKEFSFAKYFKTNQGEVFYYSIPSGGAMYDFYTEMWTNGQKSSTMESAMNLVGVKRAYFVLPNYWTRFDSIAAGAKKTADRWESIENGKIFVFEYKRKI